MNVMKNQTLSLVQIASICGVSLSLVRRWIEKKGLKVDLSEGMEEKVHHSDMINFLVKYNMHIPDSIIPIKAKKILFIYSNTANDKVFLKFLINFLGKLKKEKCGFIADHILYGHDAKMKIMVFNPDLIILDMTDGEEKAIEISKIIKSLDEFASVNILAITNEKIFKKCNILAKQYGIDDVIIGSADIDRYVYEKIGF
jgi:hypothetical protein